MLAFNLMLPGAPESKQNLLLFYKMKRDDMQPIECRVSGVSEFSWEDSIVEG